MNKFVKVMGVALSVMMLQQVGMASSAELPENCIADVIKQVKNVGTHVENVMAAIPVAEPVASVSGSPATFKYAIAADFKVNITDNWNAIISAIAGTYGTYNPASNPASNPAGVPYNINNATGLSTQSLKTFVRDTQCGTDTGIYDQNSLKKFQIAQTGRAKPAPMPMVDSPGVFTHYNATNSPAGLGYYGPTLGGAPYAGIPAGDKWILGTTGVEGNGYAGYYNVETGLLDVTTSGLPNSANTLDIWANPHKSGYYKKDGSLDAKIAGAYAGVFVLDETAPTTMVLQGDVFVGSPVQNGYYGDGTNGTTLGEYNETINTATQGYFQITAESPTSGYYNSTNGALRIACTAAVPGDDIWINNVSRHDDAGYYTPGETISDAATLNTAVPANDVWCAGRYNRAVPFDMTGFKIFPTVDAYVNAVLKHFAVEAGTGYHQITLTTPKSVIVGENLVAEAGTLVAEDQLVGLAKNAKEIAEHVRKHDIIETLQVVQLSATYLSASKVNELFKTKYSDIISGTGTIGSVLGSLATAITSVTDTTGAFATGYAKVLKEYLNTAALICEQAQAGIVEFSPQANNLLGTGMVQLLQSIVKSYTLQSDLADNDAVYAKDETDNTLQGLGNRNAGYGI